MIKYLFFDMGSTLIDESACIEHRIVELLKQKNAPSREVLLQRMRENASQKRLPYKDTAKDFGLEIMEWPRHLERLYEGVPEMLEALHDKYKLGIIANQSLGSEARLKTFGIHNYFDVIVASAEEGISKPDLRIYKRALERANCQPEEACMIGDRLDNDIAPALELGMQTIWVKQGAFAYGDLSCMTQKPDIIVEKVTAVLKHF